MNNAPHSQTIQLKDQPDTIQESRKIDSSSFHPFILHPACFWDIDGTLIDTTTLIVDSLDFVYKRYFGRTLPPDAIRALIGTPLYKQIRVFGELEPFGRGCAGDHGGFYRVL